MKRFSRWLSLGLVVLVVVLGVAISLTIGWRPFLGPRARALTGRKFEATPEHLARGRYLANSVMGCTDCHSDHDWKAPGAPALEPKLGAGQIFPSAGLPGRVVAPNLTPDPDTGAGTWSDDALARAIREGVGHDGRALFPLMPHEDYHVLSDEDLASIVVYLRSLPPVRNPLPRTEIIFPVNYLIRSVPQPITAPVPPPDQSTPVRRGEYLVRLASCRDCHTPQQRGKYNMALAFAGGFEFKGPLPTVTSTNITPDPSGISYYDQNLFVQAMRTGKVGARELSGVMPWIVYGNMTDEDLKATFAYLRTLRPVRHRVDNTLPPTACKICRGKHGAGDQN
ncbi:MAG: c-type cytochrome [Candidatus Sulfotelmatobacter sp.]